MSELNELRSALISEAGGFLRGFARFQFAFELVFIIGGAACAGLGEALDIKPLFVGGIISVFVGSALSLMLRRSVGTVFEDASRAVELGVKAEEDRDAFANKSRQLSKALKNEQDAAELQDKRRRHRLQAYRIMLETIEAANIRGARVDEAANNLAKGVFDDLRRALEHDGEGQISLSIFRMMRVGSTDKMVKIGGASSNPVWNRANARSWAWARGFTGVCWRNAAEGIRMDVVEPDTSKEHIADTYPVDEPDPERDNLYKSVAAIPILLGKDDVVWGVVTACSSAVDTFKRDPENLKSQNVDMIRDVARCASLLPGLPV